MLMHCETIRKGQSALCTIITKCDALNCCSPISMYLESSGVPMALQSTRTCWRIIIIMVTQHITFHTLHAVLTCIV